MKDTGEPLQLSGRGAELAALARHVRAHRLVAVTGPAGSGKTRLVRAWAADSRPVWLDLSGVRGPLAAVAALAAALDVEVDPGEVLERLRKLKVPLVVDGAERAPSLLDEVTSRVPRLHVVATTTAALEAPAEVVLGPLEPGDARGMYAAISGMDPGDALTGIEALPGAVRLLAGAVEALPPRDLARGRVTDLKGVVAACWRRLPPADRDALLAASAPVGALPRGAWTDEEAVARLLDWGLLESVTGGASVPTAVRPQLEGHPVPDAWGTWLLGHAHELDPRSRLTDLLAASRRPEVLAVLLELDWIPIGLLEDALDDLPPTPVAWRLRARSLRRQDRHLEAEAALELALRAEHGVGHER